MSPPPPGVEVRDAAGGRVYVVQPLRSRSADEAVGFVLLPILQGLVAMALAYLVVAMGIAVTGHDPAFQMHRLQPGLIGLGAITWAGSLIWYRWFRAKTEVQTLELSVGGGRVRLADPGGRERWEFLLADLDRVAPMPPPEVGLHLEVRGAEDRDLPMAGSGRGAAEWLAEALTAQLPA